MIDNSPNELEPHTLSQCPLRRPRTETYTPLHHPQIEPHTPSHQSPDTPQHSPFSQTLSNTLCRLSSTSTSLLVSNSPIHSTLHLPEMATTFISPMKERDTRLLSHQPRTEYEVELQQALRRSNGLINQQKEWLMAMQAQNILQDMYTRRLRTQLEYQEEKAAGKKSTRLHVDGHPRLLTNAAFIELVEQSRQKKEEEEAEAARKKDAKTHAQKQLTSALLKWEAECQKIEEDNTN
ncbi:hypothetical protein F5051DRAFT_447019 [Lentinula edodes]|nr:hypothetical protein F5051DRAFT_447019 [Lentinula edodes]